MELTMMLCCCLVMAVVTLCMYFANKRLHCKNDELRLEKDELERKLGECEAVSHQRSIDFGRVVNENIKLRLKEIFEDDKIKVECRYECGCPLNKKEK